MGPHKFDPRKLEKLDDPARFETLPPEVLWNALGAPAGAQAIVEIGAGTGLFAAEFARRAPKATVYAVDVSDEALAWMHANRPEAAEGRVVPIKAEEARVPLADGVADVVCMINLHHELAEPEATYAEAFRLLRPGGRILAVDWAPRETPGGPPLHVRVGASDLARCLTRAGFVEARAESRALRWHVLATARREGG